MSTFGKVARAQVENNDHLDQQGMIPLGFCMNWLSLSIHRGVGTTECDPNCQDTRCGATHMMLAALLLIYLDKLTKAADTC